MTISSNLARLDTNVLIHAVFPAMAQHAASGALVDSAKSAGAGFGIAPQNLVAFFAVVTDPRWVTQPKTPTRPCRRSTTS